MQLDSMRSWKLHPEHRKYLVHPDGIILTKWRRNSKYKFELSPTWMSQPLATNAKRYKTFPLRIQVGDHIIKRNALVHRFVLETFVGPCPPGMETRHLNDIRDDNRLSNLAWGTQEENKDDRLRNGGYARGSKSAQAKLDEIKVNIIRWRIACGTRSIELAEKFGVAQSTIQGIAKGKLWPHVEGTSAGILSLSELAEVPRELVYARIKNGWPLFKAVSTPILRVHGYTKSALTNFLNTANDLPTTAHDGAEAGIDGDVAA